MRDAPTGEEEGKYSLLLISFSLLIVVFLIIFVVWKG